jgi:hypothetical protein
VKGHTNPAQANTCFPCAVSGEFRTVLCLRTSKQLVAMQSGKKSRSMRSWMVVFVVGACGALATGVLWSEDGKLHPSGYGSANRAEEIADAIAKNGPLFVDWPTPKLALVFSGEMNGFLEPCGCAGLENQKGGLKRRHSFLKSLEEKGWPTLPIDLGGQVRRSGPQAEIKYRTAMQSLVGAGYPLIALGSKELQLSSDAVLYVLANLDPQTNPLVSANLELFGQGTGFAEEYRVVTAGGKRVGFTAVMGSKHQRTIDGIPDIEFGDPTAALRQIVPKLQAENCDLLILGVHGDPGEAREFARQFPQFHLVATTGGAEEPPNRLNAIEGSPAMLTEVGHKGMYTTVVGLYDDPQEPFRYQRVPLDHRFEDSPEMKRIFVEYQNELKQMSFAGLGITGIRNPVDSFVGSETCANCHTEATEKFETTPHFHATDSIVHLDPPRQYDPECLSCHVTGWNPQEYFPYVTGFMNLEDTAHLVGNGCENCHGPGAAHVAAEMGEVDVDDTEIERLRARMRMEIVENEGNKEGQVLGAVVNNCMECHDLDNSPDFDFQTFWPQIEHKGKY